MTTAALSSATETAQVTTTPLGTRRTPLLTLLPADGALAWVRRGEGLVGWGEADRLEVSGPGALDTAAEWWAERCALGEVRDPLGVPGDLGDRPRGTGFQHPLGEVAGDRVHAAGGELDGGDRRPGRDVEHRRARPSAQRVAGGPPPAGVQPARQHGVRHVVAPRDPVEHRRNHGRALVQPGPRPRRLRSSTGRHVGDATCAPPTLER